MSATRTLEVSTPTEREIVMTRIFDAPRDIVFEAWTRPELLTRWLGIRNGWTFPVCEVDLTVGGTYRWIWRSPAGEEVESTGAFQEIARPERLVSTERMRVDRDWYPGQALNAMVLTESDGRTTCTTTARFDSQEIRDMALQSGMADGVSDGYDNLDEVLAALLAAQH